MLRPFLIFCFAFFLQTTSFVVTFLQTTFVSVFAPFMLRKFFISCFFCNRQIVSDKVLFLFYEDQQQMSLLDSIGR
jgi:hypothetical protein